jgi:hypothetical protein
MGCLIVGDEGAINLHQYRQECAIVAHSGINSNAWLNMHYKDRQVHDQHLSTVVISLGDYDTNFANTKNNMQYLRHQFAGKRVFWLLPDGKKNPLFHMAVLEVANEWGDFTFEKHGDSFRTVAQQTK